MLLKLTTAKISGWTDEHPVWVSFAPGVVAYMERRTLTYKVNAKNPEKPFEVAEVPVEYTLIAFNSATHDDMNSVAVVETPEQIMEMGIPRLLPSGRYDWS